MKKPSAIQASAVSPVPLADKALEFAPGSRDAMLEMPEQIRRKFGFQLRQVQKRETLEGASQAEIELIRSRLQFAKAHYADNYEQVEQTKQKEMKQ